ncbi:MAG TPA: hypothetical protein VFX70_03950 [Mycobacteriales bacterium]|nr:hypothetical protein [Mycobacteriales bacterium]
MPEPAVPHCGAPTNPARRSGRARAALGPVAMTVLASLTIVFTSAVPAWAHVGGGGPAPSNWRSPVTSVRPAMPGVVLRTVDNGDFVELVNRSRVPVTVLGYDDEPYLRIGPGGVDQNSRSAATYLNRTKDGRTNPPADALDPTATPVWQHVTGEPRYRWHDHRTHWMLTQPPPAVTAAPGRAQDIASWTLNLRYGTAPVTVTGTLSWVPGPSPWPWYALTLGLALAAGAAGWLSRWRGPAAVVVLVLVAADVTDTIGVGLSGGSAADIPIWGAGVWALVALARRRTYAPLLLGLVGTVVAVVSGLGDLGVLSHSQVPFTGPAWLARLCVAAALGLGVGLLAAAWRVSRRDRLPPRPATAAPGRTGLAGAAG